MGRHVEENKLESNGTNVEPQDEGNGMSDEFDFAQDDIDASEDDGDIGDDGEKDDEEPPPSCGGEQDKVALHINPCQIA